MPCGCGWREAGGRVLGVPIVYEDLDGGSAETGSWDADQERANARHAAADPDVLAYIATLDADAAPHSIPITNQAGLLQTSPCNTRRTLREAARVLRGLLAIRA
jgi:ABC-type branched-subunit amino acid transport system substrate-binding protein